MEQCSAKKPLIHVACGVLVDDAGRVLLAQRPEGKIAAGWWEFPGGKIEAGETALAALTRELAEELDIRIRHAEPLIRFEHAYSNRIVVLDTWRVGAFEGEAKACEGQTLRWLAPRDFAGVRPLLPTVRPIERALRAPAHYVFTPPALALDIALAGLPDLPSQCWLRLRLPTLEHAAYEHYARRLLPAARALGITVLLDRAPEQVDALGADGWHASSRVLRGLGARPAVPLAVASTHDAGELEIAAALGFDAAVLGPVLATASHPGAPHLGWPGFAALRGERPLPVLAIGGMEPDALPTARLANAQGLAGIGAYWRR